jgi:hypothetical protein
VITKLIWAVTSLAVVGLVACSSRSSLPESLAGVAAAPITPGVGLGELKLATTTMQDFLQRHGAGRPATLVGDDLEFEFIFADGQLVVSFFAPTECRSALAGRVSESANMLRDVPEFLGNYPACGASLLNRISVSAQIDSHEGFYSGTADQGITIDTTLVQLLGRGQDGAAAQDDSHQRGVSIGGNSGTDDALDEIVLAEGFKVHIGNSPSGPNKGRLVVRKMTLFGSVSESELQ